MTWLQRYRIRHHLRNSIWILPVLGIIAALAAVPLLHAMEEAMGSKSAINPETARAVLGTLAASMFTFIVFVCSALLVAVQLASAQLTPRIIAIVFRDPGTKFSLTVFVFTFTFSLAVLVRINTSVPLFTTRLAAYCCLASLGVFLYLIDHVGKTLRPSGALRAVASLGRAVIEDVYPRRLTKGQKAPQEPFAILSGEPTLTVTNLKDGVVRAVDIDGLVALAQRADCVIEMVPQVGDFVAVGDPLFRVFQGGATLTAGALRQSVAVGQERTLEQDPALALRIMVDIASKGLSPAINDPTTAVLAIDQIHHLLRNVGSRHLDDERVRDAAGRVRARIPNAGMGGFRAPGGHGNPPFRRREHPDLAAIAGHAGEPDSDVARRASPAAAPGIEPAATVGRTLLSGTGGSSPGRRWRLSRGGQPLWAGSKLPGLDMESTRRS